MIPWKRSLIVKAIEKANTLRDLSVIRQTMVMADPWSVFMKLSQETEDLLEMIRDKKSEIEAKNLDNYFEKLDRIKNG